MKWILFCVVKEIFCNFAGIWAYMLESLYISCFNLNKIFEDRFLFEEGAYRAYVTDEKRNIDQKDIHNCFDYDKIS